MVMKSRFKIESDSNSWVHIFEELEGYSPNYSFKIARWLSPPINCLKCNTNGTSKGSPGPSSAAFNIRGHLGDLVIAKGFKIQDTMNLVVEARAIKEGLLFCKDKSIEHVIIESESMAMVQIFEGKWDTPWSVALEVNKINELRGCLSARVHHSFKEGNTLADYFANLVFHASDLQLNQYHDIPNKGKAILNMEKIGTPQIRRSITNC
ncbi:hypothetical protein RDI58_015024 [Solanum bulbocastanum]|uniref:RNase H type-1 domain-containing protein n=1 Tax=Solanum bulbocastanum TaxID=147425 RepID=A0AAN8TGZ9_SOLBU